MATLGTVIGRGATGSKPAADAVPAGSIYYDTTEEQWERSTGADWEVCEPSAGSGGYTEGARVSKAAAQTLSNNTTTLVTWPTEDYDTDTIHDAVTNPERLTCKTAGKYIVGANFSFASNATGYRRSYIYLNGATVIADMQVAQSASSKTSLNLVTIYELEVNDYIECYAFQNSGGDLNIDGDGKRTSFWMQRIG